MLSLTWIWPFMVIISASHSEEQTPGHPCSLLCNSEHFCGCSSMNLKDFPSGLPRDVQDLDLSSNKINLIKETDLKDYGQLRMLLLQLNEINTIHNDAFTFNRNLEHLDLSHNSLTTLQFAWFRTLVSLKVLNLLGNYYTTLGANPLFAHLSRLRCLKFGNANFAAVENHDFEGVIDLEVLELDMENLSNYANGSLSTVKNITHMCVNVKQELLFSILGDVMYSVTWLELRNAVFETPESAEGMTILTDSAVQKLTFRNASLTDISVLNLINIMNKYKHVSELDLEECTLNGTGRAPPIITIGPHSIRIATIRKLIIPNFFLFSDLHFLYDVAAHFTSVTCVDSKVFLVPCHFAQSFKLLQYLDLSRNLLLDLPWQFSSCYFEGRGAWPLLRTLNLSRNSLQNLGAIAESLSKQEHLMNLDISENSFAKQMPHLCLWPKSLRYLNLSTCQIKKLSQCIPITLEILDVSNNALSEFVIKVPNLKELYISKNRLVSFPSIDSTPNLIMLTISANSLNRFSQSDLDPLKYLEALDSRDNNYICSCEFLSFIHSEKGGSPMLVGWPANYVCDSPFSLKGIHLEDAHLPLFVCYQILIVSLICSAVLLVLIIGAALCYKYHTIWYARMIWAWLKAKKKPRKLLKEDICYDAFVSYSEQDSDWVENIMASELENTSPPLKLCLHKRNFVPGKWIIDNIIDCMEKSHKTVFVLSESFVQSEWCKYELEFSHFRLFDESNDATILILLEPIEKETIPKRFCKLRKLMNTKTYMEWSLEEDQQQIFWFNLRCALKMEAVPKESEYEPLI